MRLRTINEAIVLEAKKKGRPKIPTGIYRVDLDDKDLSELVRRLPKFKRIGPLEDGRFMTLVCDNESQELEDLLKELDFKFEKLDELPKNINEEASRSDIPPVVYHGTNSDFEKFDINKVGENTGNYGHYGYGIYFSDSEREAATYGDKIKKYKITISNPFIASDEQYLELQKLGWNVGDYGNVGIKFDSVIKALKGKTELEYFAQALKKQGDKAWDMIFSKYPDYKDDKLNDLYELYSVSDANNHNEEINQHAIDMTIEYLGLKPDDVEYNHGFTYKMPLHYVTNTGEYGKQLTDDLKKMGHDGVIYGSEFVIFDANQAELVK